MAEITLESTSKPVDAGGIATPMTADSLPPANGGQTANGDADGLNRQQGGQETQ